MDHQIPSHLQAKAWLLALLIFLPIIIFWGMNIIVIGYKMKKMKKLPPEVPGAWPIIGHLLMLDRVKNVPFARTLAAMTHKNGPIFTIRMGMFPYLVVSNWEAAKDCFTTHDKDFAARPTSLAGKYTAYGYARFSHANYGPYYCHVRKLVMQQALSRTRLDKMKRLRICEVESSIKHLFSSTQLKENNNTSEIMPSTKVNMTQWLEILSLNIIVKMVCGKRYDNVEEDEEAQCLKRVFKDIMYVAGQIVLYDAVPFPLFKYVDFQGHVKVMKRIHKDIDVVLQSWLDDHIKKAEIGKHDENQDVIDALLSATDYDEFKAYGYSQQTVIKATVMAIILDGADTTAVQWTWLMSLLLNNPNVMRRAREEIHIKVGKNKWIEESDVQDLAYLQAIIKEALRLYPPAPLLVPHEAVKDCKILGYDVPKGTRLFVNAWKIHRDPRIWPDPERFMPERFLTDDQEKIDACGQSQHFDFIPFGSGRRLCPGMNFAALVTLLTFARLLQGFDISTPCDMPVDMTEGLGINMPKATTLEVLITPRLPSMMY
ncbi:nicotine N-demethylase CYP82E3-like [Lycium ferocissimum]|uniref:nicotine N-demethylase CYP82E3-like n=1 Tax=Lycium ferocissimum TaxID=112874 RepID=UPI00281497C8|nr:nicotine N-demethylase CYP82E3-like [Lycium ferocissimum]